RPPDLCAAERVLIDLATTTTHAIGRADAEAMRLDQIGLVAAWARDADVERVVASDVATAELGGDVMPHVVPGRNVLEQVVLDEHEVAIAEVERVAPTGPAPTSIRAVEIVPHLHTVRTVVDGIGTPGIVHRVVVDETVERAAIRQHADDHVARD